MIDIYKSIGISPRSSKDKIRKSLSVCLDDDTKTRIQEILLNDHRKFVYDRDREHLIKLAKLRTHFGLPKPERMDDAFFQQSKPRSITLQLKKTCILSSLVFFLIALAIGFSIILAIF